jgi:glycolate oxidase FAD binding subunit
MASEVPDWTDQVRAAVARAAPLRIRGGGSKDWYGETLEGELLDTRSHTGIIDYDPTELVITARCGTPLAQIEAALAERGQMLACESPHFGAHATIGGCVAAGLSGPRRATAGSVRDFVLGAKLINGRGEHLAFGGQVIKNVAGYDVSRLLAGSLGILGLITEVSLKLVPRPVAEATLRFDGIDQARAIRQLNEWGGRPLPVSATAWRAGTLDVRLSGAEAAVRAACAALGGERVEAEQAQAFWAGVREHTDAFFAQSGALWRLSVPGPCAPIALPGGQLIEWGGALRWLKTDADTDPAAAAAAASSIRSAAATAGGHATLFRATAGQPRSSGCFAPLDPVLLRIHQRLKAEFDPLRLFNRGRLYPEL